MELSTFKQLKDLNQRLQERGFSWHHDDYCCLREALPELIEHYITNQSSGRETAQAPLDCKAIIHKKGESVVGKAESRSSSDEYLEGIMKKVDE